MWVLVCYVAMLVIYVVVDAAWLSVMAKLLYRPALGDILLPGLKWPPALIFYLIYPIGALALAVLPALRQGNLAAAVINGALFGAIAYATYDLTNFATLRNWTLQITLIDIFYGAVATALASAAGFWVGRLVSR
jgi:uncharacterized membrane protein